MSKEKVETASIVILSKVQQLMGREILILDSFSEMPKCEI